MKVTPTPDGKSIIGISGHAGVGHAHSHCGFVQDDSAGFTVAIEILKNAFPADTTISEVSADVLTGLITVTTKDGGIGTASPRRGITPHEATMMSGAVGLDSLYSHSVAFQTFGRIYGQGVLEAPVAFQAACCLAVLNTFDKKYPGQLVRGNEDMPGKIGGCIGARVKIHGVPVSIMGLVNANEGGIGPAEDLEGNIALGDKGRAMKELGLDRLPTIILESKAYVPAVCEGVDHDNMWIRCNSKVDNIYVYDALIEAAKELELPYMSSDAAYPRHTDEMKDADKTLSKRITEVGEAFATNPTSDEKVRLISELAVITSQDAGGVTFMSSHMHNQVGGGGIMPGTSAVLSMAVSENYINEWKIPAFQPEDASNYIKVICKALPVLAANADKAQAQLDERFTFDAAEHDFLFEASK